jgi:hypothetical protein
MPRCPRIRTVQPAVRALAMVSALLLLLSAPRFASTGAAQQADLGFSPASGHAHVIAQGVAELPAGDVVWRTVRTRAPLPSDAPFEERPLGFVFAATGPLLLTDEATGQQMHLGTGEAALVPAGTVQQRASLAAQPVSYLSIELVSVDAPAPPEDATVLQPGQPFPAPSGRHDLDLLSDTLAAGETFVIPDSGAKNVILITDGAASVGRPGGETVVLIAGEAASFSGELGVGPAPDGAGAVSFLVAMIGPEIAPPAIAPAAETATVAAAETPTAESAQPETGEGSIAIQVFLCPPGMDAATVAAAACAPAIGDFDVTLSGEGIAAPLTLGDARADGDSFIWSGLPYGEYVIAEAVLPSGATSYVLSARDASGGPATGYRVTLSGEQSDLTVRIYNFVP